MLTRKEYSPPSTEEALRYEILESINSLAAVLDEGLTIIHANDQWNDFIDEQGITVSTTGVGYFDLLQGTQQLYREQIADVANALQKILANSVQDFDFYYLIHSSGKRGHLKLHAELITVEDRRRLLICHEIANEPYVPDQEKIDVIQMMISGVSHSVNEVLASIKRNCELIQHELRSNIRTNIRANSILMRIFDSINSAPQLTEKFLLYSQVADTELEDVNMGEIVNSVIDSLHTTLPPTIKINTALDTQTCIIRAKSVQLHQALLHLFDNSIYAIAGKPGYISITLQQNQGEPESTADESLDLPSTGSYVHLRFEDNGHGMNEETLKRCFEPFYTAKPFGYSTGLGLPLVRRIIMNFGGHIVVTSKAGFGTIFDIYFPCGKDESTTLSL